MRDSKATRVASADSVMPLNEREAKKFLFCIRGRVGFPEVLYIRKSPRSHPAAFSWRKGEKMSVPSPLKECLIKAWCSAWIKDQLVIADLKPRGCRPAGGRPLYRGPWRQPKEARRVRMKPRRAEALSGQWRRTRGVTGLPFPLPQQLQQLPEWRPPLPLLHSSSYSPSAGR